MVWGWIMLGIILLSGIVYYETRTPMEQDEISGLISNLFNQNNMTEGNMTEEMTYDNLTNAPDEIEINGVKYIKKDNCFIGG